MSRSIPVYSPIYDHAKELAQAEASATRLSMERNDRWYPKYHIASNGGWLNDPNGLCCYQGRWHVYYQLNPYGTQWGPMHWGHVSSRDMVTWKREPIAMAPSLEEEKDGVFSGCAVIDDAGQLRFYYTGHRWNNGRDNAQGQRQVQMLATAQDEEATKLDKLGMIIDCSDERVGNHFRDPKVWKQDGVWTMIHGVSTADGRGQIWLYTTEDMVEWTFSHVLYENPDPNVYMLECPDFFPLTASDGSVKWVLCFSAMGSKCAGYMNRNESNAGYIIGTWQTGEAFRPESEFRPLDCGANFYAPQSTEASGRRIMIGWMSPFSQSAPMQSDGWCGQMTLPREVFLGEDGDMYTAPVPEIDYLRIDAFSHPIHSLEANAEMLIAEDAEAVEIEFNVDLNRSTAERAGLKVHATPDGSYTYVAFDSQTGTVLIDRQAAARGDRGYRAAPLTSSELSADELRLRIFLDRGSVEVYVNDGHHVLSSYSYPSSGHRAVKLMSESGSLVLGKLIVHDMRSIGLE
ncbi:sucrose-6-phosphate hydrolase [Bifidobacterium subtile]|jgi:beta-fructofuranosidase|uniref:glycoside hydrolase family 32 protein n=1 Tax=Bifidobacterium subtile TaxID=77635 RepID=UPI002F3514F1